MAHHIADKRHAKFRIKFTRKCLKTCEFPSLCISRAWTFGLLISQIFHRYELLLYSEIYTKIHIKWRHSVVIIMFGAHVLLIFLIVFGILYICFRCINDLWYSDENERKPIKKSVELLRKHFYLQCALIIIYSFAQLSW